MRRGTVILKALNTNLLETGFAIENAGLMTRQESIAREIFPIATAYMRVDVSKRMEQWTHLADNRCVDKILKFQK